MILAFIRWLATKLPRRDIYGEAGLYLSRYRVFGWMPGSRLRWPFSVYLHQFHRPDEDADCPHSHPWAWAVSLILSGGYTEERVAPPFAPEATRLTRLRAGRFNRLRSDTFHVVTELHGETWTLIVVGPKTASWGFIVPGKGFVPWRERLAQRGLKAGN